MKIQVCARCKGSVTENRCTCAAEFARQRLELKINASSDRPAHRVEVAPVPMLDKIKAAIRRCLPSDARGRN